MAQIIPLTSNPRQTSTVSLNVDGNNLTLKLAINYNSMANYWTMDVSDAQGNLLVGSIPLVCGQYPAANVLQQHGYLRIGSAFVINAGSAAQDYPGSANLGTAFVLVWDDTPPV